MTVVVPTAAQHIVIDAWGACPDALRNKDLIVQALLDGARASGATVLHSHAHDFEGDGVTAMLVLSESHSSAHTWPALGYVSFDAYTCGDCETDKFVEPFVLAVKATHVEVRRIERGVRGTVQADPRFLPRRRAA